MKINTDERILNAAEKIFSENGYLGATTQKIARSAKVNEVTVFRRFKNKNLLFTAVIERFVKKQSKILATASQTDASLESVLYGFADAYSKSVGKSPDFIRTMLGEMPRHPHEVKCVIAGVIEPVRKQFLLFLLSRQKAGEIDRKVNCELMLDIFRGTLFAHTVMPQIGKRSYSNKQYIRECIKIFLNNARL